MLRGGCQRRDGQEPYAPLVEALAILGTARPPSTPAAVLTDIGRPGQHVRRTTLAELDPAGVGMLSLVIVGATSTRWIGERMVTPRGYTNKYTTEGEVLPGQRPGYSLVLAGSSEPAESE